jgi:hypothetical protein
VLTFGQPLQPQLPLVNKPLILSTNENLMEEKA